jgi:hypothetical protein
LKANTAAPEPGPAATPAPEPLGTWSRGALLAGLLAALVGTILAIADVNVGGLMRLAVGVLLIAGALLAAAGIMRTLLDGD